jgi:hypothetical protein
MPRKQLKHEKVTEFFREDRRTLWPRGPAEKPRRSSLLDFMVSGGTMGEMLDWYRAAVLQTKGRMEAHKIGALPAVEALEELARMLKETGSIRDAWGVK